MDYDYKPHRQRSRRRSASDDNDVTTARSSSASASTTPNYSSEDAFIVSHILENRRDFYALLQVPQNPFDPQEATKSYRRFAKAVHPDKNKSPDATEAFKVLGQAYSTLSDEQKRRQYDALLDSGELLHAPDDAAVNDIYFRMFGFGVVKLIDWMGLLDANVDRRAAVYQTADLGRQLWLMYRDSRRNSGRIPSSSSSSSQSRYYNYR